MVPIPFIEQADKKGYWINELESLGISPEEIEKEYESESDCITELAGHVKNTKEALYQEYKTSYSERMIQLEGEEEKNAIVV